MNENVKLWIEALRSGKFEQCQNQLRKTGTDGTYYYCCLGVASQLYMEQTGEGEWEFAADHRIDQFKVGNFRNSGLLTNQVREWLGLQSAAGGYNTEEGHGSLAILNDLGKTFEEIADVIESEPKGLFADVAA